MSNCTDCGKELNVYDIGIHKKLVNRGAESFRCMNCTARHFDISIEMLWDKVDLFVKQECSLFPKKGEETEDYRAK